MRQRFSCAPCQGIGNKAAVSGREFTGAVRQGFGPFPREDMTAAAMDPGIETGALSEPVLTALEAVLLDAASCSTFAVLLEEYRRAVCTACIDCQQLARTAAHWETRLRDDETLPIRTAALHGSVISWVRCSWSADWLCGYSSRSGASYAAIFRQSSEILSALDFDAELTWAGFSATWELRHVPSKSDAVVR